MTRERSLGRIVAGLVPFNIASQAASFAAWIAFAHVLGASTHTDAYLLAFCVPAIVYSILLVGVNSGAIPSLTQESARGEAAESRAANTLIAAALVGSAALTTVVTIIAVAATPLVVGSNGRLLSDTRLMIVELSPLGVLGAITGVLSALLSVRGKFAPAVAVTAFDPILRTILVIALGHVI